MKIYIVGSVASGKTTLARHVSKMTGIPCRHLDEVVHIHDPADPWGDRKRPIEERDALFAEILAGEHYIIEDTGRECFAEGMRQADTVILLDIPPHVRRRRIIFRWVKQNLGVEKCEYRPSLGMLKAMFRWAMNYDTGADGTKARVVQLSKKIVVLRNSREIEAYLRSMHGSL